jgi:HKD family nuclease
VNGYIITQPNGALRTGDFLTAHLTERRWTSFRSAVAFVKESGVLFLRPGLGSFSQHGTIKVSVGVNFGGTSLEGIIRLHESVGNGGEVWVFKNENGSTFHPKAYVFANDDEAHVLIGSGNITRGGLYTNYEAATVLELDLTDDLDRQQFDVITKALDAWTDSSSGLACLLNNDLLDRLATQGYLPPEVYSRESEEAGVAADGEGHEPLFATVTVPPAPAYPQPTAQPAVAPASGGPTTFLMTLQYVDLSRGQLTPGAHERSPEIYIPLAARNYAPAFWDWPNGFNQDQETPNKLDRFGVRMLIGTSIEDVTMAYFPHRHEFRIRSRALQNSGAQPGDILRIERTKNAVGYLYHVTIIPQGLSQYAATRALCVNAVRNSAKEWGYV